MDKERNERKPAGVLFDVNNKCEQEYMGEECGWCTGYGLSRKVKRGGQTGGTYS